MVSTSSFYHFIGKQAETVEVRAGLHEGALQLLFTSPTSRQDTLLLPPKGKKREVGLQKMRLSMLRNNQSAYKAVAKKGLVICPRDSLSGTREAGSGLPAAYWDGGWLRIHEGEDTKMK